MAGAGERAAPRRGAGDGARLVARGELALLLRRQALVLLPALAHLVLLLRRQLPQRLVLLARGLALLRRQLAPTISSAAGCAAARRAPSSGSAARCRATSACAARRGCSSPDASGASTCFSCGDSCDHDGDPSAICAWAADGMRAGARARTRERSAVRITAGSASAKSGTPGRGRRRSAGPTRGSGRRVPRSPASAGRACHCW